MLISRKNKSMTSSVTTGLVGPHLPRYQTPDIVSHIKEKDKAKELNNDEKYYNKLVRKFIQPIESLINWIHETTGIEKASKVRSTEGLMIHCWDKLAVALFLLVFYY
jgi:hypothetical protein